MGINIPYYYTGEAVISPSGCICLGGAGVVDLDIFVGAGARVSKQVRADGNCARVVAVTSEMDKVTNKSGKNVQLEHLLLSHFS